MSDQHNRGSTPQEGQLPPALGSKPPPNVARSKTSWLEHIASISPILREGLWAEDVLGHRGWRCDRYVQLVMMRAGTNPIEGLRWHIKSKTYKTAMEKWVCDDFMEMARFSYPGDGYIILDVIRDEPIEDEYTGVVGTPHLVITYGHANYPGQICTCVYNVVTCTQSKWMRRQTRLGYSTEKFNRRLLTFYAQLLEAEHANFIFGVIDDRPGAVRPDSHVLHQQPLDISGQRLVPFVQERVYRLESLIKEGKYAPKTTVVSCCTACPLSTACLNADREQPIGEQ